MEKSNILQEYCARFGINKGETKSLAQQIAEEKYQSLVERDISLEEARNIQYLIEEISEWSAAKAYVISAA